ncbi:helix-hairpin-helix domain-containing protein [Desulforhopalus sp. 52FAK]
MATPITSVSGIGAQTADILMENGFQSAEALAAAKEEDLLKISGFGPSKAKKFIAAAQALVGTAEEGSAQQEPVQPEIEASAEVEVAEEKTEEKVEKSSGPKVVTQKLCKKKKKKKKDKAGKSKSKKKKKSSRKKKSK